MNKQLRILIVIVATALAFLVGYTVSSGTGVEPGYFEAPDAGGYGAGADSGATEGVSGEFQEYYKELTE